MSKIYYLKNYRSSQNSRTENYDFQSLQLSLLPLPKLNPEKDKFYYVMDVKKEKIDSIKDFLSTARIMYIYELRKTPTFYTENLDRSIFFSILKDLKIKYLYPADSSIVNSNGICFLVDDVDIGFKEIKHRLVEIIEDNLQVQHQKSNL